MYSQYKSIFFLFILPKVVYLCFKHRIKKTPFFFFKVGWEDLFNTPFS